MKGDRVEIEVDTGDGTRTYEVAATRAGRRVEVSTGRGIVEVSEVTRTGTAVRTARFMASRVVALVEHPADTSTAGLPARPAYRHGRLTGTAGLPARPAYRHGRLTGTAPTARPPARGGNPGRAGISAKDPARQRAGKLSRYRGFRCGRVD